MKHLKFLAAVCCVVLCAGCQKEKPEWQKVMYKVGDTEVTTYQWMTRTEAEATFSKYSNVRIFEEKAAGMECLLKNEDNK